LKTTGMFTSEHENWETPQDLFDKLDHMFSFELDVCASPENAKVSKYYTKQQNSLSLPWSRRNWMNPPYGRTIGEWCCKASEVADGGGLTVALLPARVDTKWFHDYCTRWHVVFLRGRLKFRLPDGKTGSAPFPSMIVYFGIPR